MQSTRSVVRPLVLGIIIAVLGAGASRVDVRTGPVGLGHHLTVAAATDPLRSGTDPPTEPDPSAPAARLTRAQAELEGLSARPERKRLVAPVAHRVAEARAEYVGGNTDVKRVMTLLSKAVREADRARTPDADTREGLRRVSNELTASSQEIARRWLAIARRAGADRAIISEAQASYDAGVGDVASGDQVDGTAKFSSAFDTIKSGIKWDIHRFFTRLVERFADQTTGLQFVMSHKGNFYDAHYSGFERMPHEEEHPGKDMNSIDPLDIASVSKILTTVAVLQLLNERGLTISSKIQSWLPPHWDKGVGVAELTFKDLLVHRSGLSKQGYCCFGWEDARNRVALGVEYDPDPNDPSKTREVYLNVNFVLLGTLMGRLEPESEAALNKTDFEALGTDEGEPGDLLYQDMVSASYEHYVYENILKPAEIFKAGGGATCIDNSPTRALYYDFDDPKAPGTTINLPGIACAYGGWHLSSSALGRFMDSLRYSEELLPKPTRELMYQDFLGWHNPEMYRWADGAWGVYHSHGGDLGLPGGVDACIMSFPNGTQVALMMNSINGDYANGDTVDGLPITYQCSGISFDFDNAWIKA